MEILRQVAAVEAALRRVAVEVTRDHVERCMADCRDRDQRDDAATDVMRALTGLVR